MPNLFRCVHGSYLYGTETPSSDKDFKGVYIADLKDLMLRQVKDSMNSQTKTDSSKKNSSDDIDIEYKEVWRFIQDCLSGQTYAMDMLFAPKKFWLEESEIWYHIQNNRDKLLSNQVQPFIHYCRNQAAKYGLKGSRLGEVIRLRDWLDDLSNKDTLKLQDVISLFDLSEYIKLVEVPSKNSEKTTTYLQVLEKQYQLNQKINSMVKTLTLWIDKYGPRSVTAMQNDGVDWKAVSHAFRCMYQVQELFSTGKITFPLVQADYLKKIKMGGLNYPDIQDELAELMENVTNMPSVLPDKPDREFWDKYICYYYELYYTRQKIEGHAMLKSVLANTL